MIGLTILGSTGSIGTSTLDVVARHRNRFRVVALSGHRNLERLYSQCLQFRPDCVAVAEKEAARDLARRLRGDLPRTRVLVGPAALEEVARLPHAGSVVAAIVGAAGLLPTLAAVRAGKRVLLANKESLVISGEIFMRDVRRFGAELLPIDSEHNAVFQCMPPRESLGEGKRGVRRIVLTASGGPFRTWPIEGLAAVTPEQACKHPNWSMGRKISIDSATMMNKGLELIEACWLFDMEPSQVDVVIHPQSVVHSLVEYVDGSLLAQLGNPDMRTPIAQALGWPERIESGVPGPDLCRLGRLDFEPVQLERFPCLSLAYEAFAMGGTGPAILNAANEIAVAGFLAGRLPFTAIPTVIESCLAAIPARPALDLETILEDDTRSRAEAERVLAAGAGAEVP